MINKTELRIGNIVKDTGFRVTSYCTVEELGRWIARLHSLSEDIPLALEYAKIEPVELSPAILEACGFHYLHSNTKRGRYYVESPYIGGELRSEIAWWPITQVISINSTFNAVGEELQYTELYLPHIRHLHQLQNLFYWITGGSELPVNLEQIKV